MLKLYQLSMLITMRCTLKCKLCLVGAPYYKPIPHYDIQEMFNSTSRILNVAHVEKMCVSGGEPLVHEGLVTFLNLLLGEKDKFDKIEITTNATLLPDRMLLDCCKQNKDKIYFLISDYGPTLSVKCKELIGLLDEHTIPYKYRAYYGDNPHFGGWADFSDMSPKGRTDEETEVVFQNCGFSKGHRHFVIMGTELALCHRIFRCRQQGYFSEEFKELLDLADETITSQFLSDWLAEMDIPKRFSYCANCPGYGDNIPRYPAAEQI